MEELRPNQISVLFIWVHPTSQPVGTRILAEWRAFKALKLRGQQQRKAQIFSR